MGPIPFIPFRIYPPRQENDNTSSTHDSEENGNKNYRPSYMLFAPTLENLKNVLYVALNPYFEEFEIAVVSCPCLNKAPYNLAAAGLSGNTGILETGAFANLYPTPQTNYTYNIYNILSRYNDDVFVIGSGFAARPYMSYDGHLTMNAVVSTNYRNTINNSCIAYHDTSTRQNKFEFIYDHTQIRCCLFGQFFFSGGKRGQVIKMRAKGRRSRSSIIMLIQNTLRHLCQNMTIIGLGIVLVINGGLTILQFVSDDFVSCRYNTVQDYFNQLMSCKVNSKNLIALGALSNLHSISIYRYNYKRAYMLDETSMFNAFHNFNYMGSFFNDLTPEETEYIVYINIAQEICF
ncbi:hypothetical protein ACFW04_005130 [Cataglyphis niger]